MAAFLISVSELTSAPLFYYFGNTRYGPVWHLMSTVFDIHKLEKTINN